MSEKSSHVCPGTSPLEPTLDPISIASTKAGTVFLACGFPAKQRTTEVLLPPLRSESRVLLSQITVQLFNYGEGPSKKHVGAASRARETKDGGEELTGGALGSQSAALQKPPSVVMVRTERR